MTDAAGTLDPGRGGRRLFFAGLLAASALSLALDFCRLGEASLKGTDEAIEALTSREMLRGGDWLTPHLNGVPRYTKPPLYFWLTAAAFRVFGETDFALRFWSAAAGVGTVVLTGLLGRRLFGDRAGVVAALALATSSQFVYHHGARHGCLDAVTTLAVTAGLLGVASRGERPRLLVAAGAAFGLACLTKNFLGFPAAALAAFYLYATRRPAPRIAPRVLASALAALLAVSLAWPAAMAILHGREFTRVFLFRETLGRLRLGGGSGLVGGQPSAAPLPTRALELAKSLFDGFFPWSLLAPLMVPWALARARDWRRDDRALIPLWIAVYGAAALAMSTSYSWYEFPFYPAVAIAIGAFASFVLSERPGRALPAAAGALAAMALLFRPNWKGEPLGFLNYSGFSVRLAPGGASRLVPFAVAAAAAALILLRPRTGKALLAAGLASVAVAFAAAPLRFPAPVSSSRLLARRIEAVAPSYGNAVTFWNLPLAAPSGDFPGIWSEARWYLFGLRGVAIANLAEETVLPESLSAPRTPALVLTRRDAAGALPPHRTEAAELLWTSRVELAGIPARP